MSHRLASCFHAFLAFEISILSHFVANIEVLLYSHAGHSGKDCEQSTKFSLVFLADFSKSSGSTGLGRWHFRPASIKNACKSAGTTRNYRDKVIRLCLQLRSAALNMVCSMFLTMPVLNGEREYLDWRGRGILVREI